MIELHGRDSVTINSGGEKVFAEEVEAALEAHPAVYDCVVAGRPSERWGSEVVAVVQLRVGAEAAADELRATAASIRPLQAAQGVRLRAGGRSLAVRQGRLPLGTGGGRQVAAARLSRRARPVRDARLPSTAASTVTSPWATTPAPNVTSPRTVRRVQSISDGGPCGEARLEVAEQLVVHGVEVDDGVVGSVAPRPPTWSPPSSSYRSERSTSRSLVVFTGPNRSRSTTQRPRAVEHLDRRAHRRLDLDHRGRRRGLRVDRLRVPDHRQLEDAVVASSSAASAARSIHMLLVLK